MKLLRTNVLRTGTDLELLNKRRSREREGKLVNPLYRSYSSPNPSREILGEKCSRARRLDAFGKNGKENWLPKNSVFSR